MARYFGYDIVFVPEAGKAGGYYVWTGTHWEHDKGNAAMYRMAKEITGIILVHASQQATMDEAGRWASYAISCGNAGKLKNMILVRTHVRTVHKSEFNHQRVPPDLREGTVDLKTGTIRPHDHNDLLTKCREHPVESRPPVCKRWLESLNECSRGTRRVIDFIQRAVRMHARLVLPFEVDVPFDRLGHRAEWQGQVHRHPHSLVGRLQHGLLSSRYVRGEEG